MGSFPWPPTLTGNYRQIDYQAGAGVVYGDTVTNLNRLSMASDHVPSELYERNITLLGDTAQLAAWLAIDLQDATSVLLRYRAPRKAKTLRCIPTCSA